MHLSITVSPRFFDVLKQSPEPAYRLWRRVGVDPTTGSKLLHGASLVRTNDERIVAVGKLLGLRPEECFECDVEIAALERR